MQQLIFLFIMSVVQGVAEFLPVSSSGHLALIGKIGGFDPESSFSAGVFLHAGSLLAVIIFYFKLLCGFLRKDQLHLLTMVIAASLPAAAAGVFFKLTGFGAALFNDPRIIGMAFLVTGMILRLTGKKKLLVPEEEAVDVKHLSLRQALIIGFVQMGALLPGISRSGSTIAAGLFSGVKREDAAAFSFLLAIPAIAGATILETADLMKKSGGIFGTDFGAGQMIFAVILSFAVSYGALKFMVNIVKKSRLSVFSWYLFALGTAVLIWQFSLLNGAK